MAPIDPSQSKAARRELGLSQADVATAVGFNRAYLSDFEGGFSTRLTNTQLKKLRAFYETKISEAQESGVEIEFAFVDSDESSTEAAPATHVEQVATRRFSFSIADSVRDETIKAVQSVIASNDAKLVDALAMAVERDNSAFGSGEFSEASLAMIREAFLLATSNYLLMRALCGWPEAGLPAGAELMQSHGDSVLGVLISAAEDQFVKAGLVRTFDEAGATR